MTFKLTPEAQARADEYRGWYNERQNTVRNLTDENLVGMTKFYMSHMLPMRYAPGEPVYDATMWHILLPELLKRIEKP